MREFIALWLWRDNKSYHVVTNLYFKIRGEQTGN